MKHLQEQAAVTNNKKNSSLSLFPIGVDIIYVMFKVLNKLEYKISNMNRWLPRTKLGKQILLLREGFVKCFC